MEIVWTYSAAAVVGASLAVSGAALQSVLRNPLAEPYLLGTVGGSAFFAALASNLGLLALGTWVLPCASFLGACFSLAIVCLVAGIAARRRFVQGSDALTRANGSTIVLAGFVTGSFCGSLNMLVMSYSEPDAFTKLSLWLYGSLKTVTPEALAVCTPVFAAVFTVLYLLARRLNVMELGPDEAEGLGINVRGTVFTVLALVALMTAVSVSLAGAIGFLGLVVPHAVRRLTGPRLQRILPFSALGGGLVLLIAQFICRQLPGDVPVGIVCALLGAPFFFGLLMSRRNGEGWDI